PGVRKPAGSSRCPNWWSTRPTAETGTVSLPYIRDRRTQQHRSPAVRWIWTNGHGGPGRLVRGDTRECETAIKSSYTNECRYRNGGIVADGGLPNRCHQRRRARCLQEGGLACAVGFQGHNGYYSPATTGYQWSGPVPGLGREIQRQTVLRVSNCKEG